jgi:hypothetical protein
MNYDWGVVVAPIIAALISLAGVYLVKPRRRIRFIILKPWDLAKPLRDRGGFEISIEGGKIHTQELITAGVVVQNVGNRMVENVEFDITFPGDPTYKIVQVAAENRKLRSEIKMPVDEDKPTRNTIFVPYMNPGDWFRVGTYFDGPLNKCWVDFHHPNTKPKYVNEEDMTRRKMKFFLWASAFRYLGLALFLFLVSILCIKIAERLDPNFPTEVQIILQKIYPNKLVEPQGSAPQS